MVIRLQNIDFQSESSLMYRSLCHRGGFVLALFATLLRKVYRKIVEMQRYIVPVGLSASLEYM